MPTLFELFGMRFFFYSLEHLPIHVHVPPNQKPTISHPDLFLGIYESYLVKVGLQCTHGLNGQAGALSNNAKINALCL